MAAADERGPGECHCCRCQAHHCHKLASPRCLATQAASPPPPPPQPVTATAHRSPPTPPWRPGSWLDADVNKATLTARKLQQDWDVTTPEQVGAPPPPPAKSPPCHPHAIPVPIPTPTPVPTLAAPRRMAVLPARLTRHPLRRRTPSTKPRTAASSARASLPSQMATSTSVTPSP